MRTLNSIVIACLLFACSPVSDPVNAPDAHADGALDPQDLGTELIDAQVHDAQLDSVPPDAIIQDSVVGDPKDVAVPDVAVPDVAVPDVGGPVGCEGIIPGGQRRPVSSLNPVQFSVTKADGHPLWGIWIAEGVPEVARLDLEPLQVVQPDLPGPLAQPQIDAGPGGEVISSVSLADQLVLFHTVGRPGPGSQTFMTRISNNGQQQGPSQLLLEDLYKVAAAPHGDGFLLASGDPVNGITTQPFDAMGQPTGPRVQLALPLEISSIQIVRAGASHAVLWSGNTTYVTRLNPDRTAGEIINRRLERHTFAHLARLGQDDFVVAFQRNDRPTFRLLRLSDRRITTLPPALQSGSISLRGVQDGVIVGAIYRDRSPLLRGALFDTDLQPAATDEFLVAQRSPTMIGIDAANQAHIFWSADFRYQMQRLDLDPCDGIDNDCDGQIDEVGLGWRTCRIEDAAPHCEVGSLQCAAGELRCAPFQNPEVCDGIDNDCDGAIDEDLGPCCEPFGEICDGQDNDCDGVVDEVEPEICGPLGQGGLTHCVDGAIRCMLPDPPVGEICNGEDDDADGWIDEGQITPMRVVAPRVARTDWAWHGDTLGLFYIQDEQQWFDRYNREGLRIGARIPIQVGGTRPTLVGGPNGFVMVWGTPQGASARRLNDDGEWAGEPVQIYAFGEDEPAQVPNAHKMYGDADGYLLALRPAWGSSLRVIRLDANLAPVGNVQSVQSQPRPTLHFAQGPAEIGLVWSGLRLPIRGPSWTDFTAFDAQGQRQAGFGGLLDSQPGGVAYAQGNWITVARQAQYNRGVLVLDSAGRQWEHRGYNSLGQGVSVAAGGAYVTVAYIEAVPGLVDDKDVILQPFNAQLGAEAPRRLTHDRGSVPDSNIALVPWGDDFGALWIRGDKLVLAPPPLLDAIPCRPETCPPGQTLRVNDQVCQGQTGCLPIGDCPEEAPVCGCDHQNYPTSCAAHQAGVGVWRLGRCESHQDCDNDCNGPGDVCFDGSDIVDIALADVFSGWSCHPCTGLPPGPFCEDDLFIEPDRCEASEPASHGQCPIGSFDPCDEGGVNLCDGNCDRCGADNICYRQEDPLSGECIWF